MKRMAWIAAGFFIMAASVTSTYADDSVEQGAEDYDWLTCLNAKSSDCINACTTSEDIDCEDNCKAIAKDKCLSEGITAPQQ